MEMNSATTTNTNWLRHMKVGRSYVRYYDSRKLLHSAQTSIYKFNKGLGDGSKVFLRTRTRVLKKADTGKMFKLSVTCQSNKKNSTDYDRECEW